MKKKSSFEKLVKEVAHCKKCSSLNKRSPVLNNNNGNPCASIMFIAEAPGRFGADKYGIPLYGDATGKNFEYFLKKSGIEREKVFITNAVLCNPRSEDGRNRAPSKEEIENCNVWLQRQIEIVNPKMVVSLGAKALRSLELIEPHGLKGLKGNVGKEIRWNNRVLIPLYHPSPLSMIYRDKKRQVADYKMVKREMVSKDIS